jgi:hypothetical protein
VRADDQIHAPMDKLDFTGLSDVDNDYLRAVADHLDWLPTSIARWQRERRKDKNP